MINFLLGLSFCINIILGLAFILFSKEFLKNTDNYNNFFEERFVKKDYE